MKNVHAEHCCKNCGCKYGEDGCSVTQGHLPQSRHCGENEVCGLWNEEGSTQTSMSFSDEQLEDICGYLHQLYHRLDNDDYRSEKELQELMNYIVLLEK